MIDDTSFRLIALWFLFLFPSFHTLVIYYFWVFSLYKHYNIAENTHHLSEQESESIYIYK